MFTKHQQSSSGFTLIELIVVIAILAVLVTIVIVAINPAEQLARSRDAKRVSDLDALRSAWNLYLSQATSVNLSGDSTANSRCVSGGGTLTYFVNTTSAISTTSLANTFVAEQSTSSQSLCATAGSCGSWAPAMVSQTPGGSPIANLPLDPTGLGGGNSSYYSYACDASDKTYEFDAFLESNYYKNTLQLMSSDGGNSSSTYEIGTKLTII